MQEEIDKLKQEIELLKQDKSIVLTCNKCDGDGYIPNNNGFFIPGRDVKCPRCKGCGFIRV